MTRGRMGRPAPWGGNVNVADFGYLAGSTWDAPFAAAAAIITARGYGTLMVPALPGVQMRLSNYLSLPSYASIEFEPGAKVFTVTGGNLATRAVSQPNANAVFMINATADGTTWVDDFPNFSQSRAVNVKVDNSLNASMVCGSILAGCSIKVETIHSFANWFTLKTTGDYVDHVSIDRAFVQEPQGSQWHISLTSLGDSWSLNQVHCYLSAGVANAVRLSQLSGGVITNSIGGNYQFANVANVTIDGMHNETGTVEFNASGGELRNSQFWTGATPRVKISGAAGQRAVRLSGVQFNQFQNLVRAITPYDIEVGSQAIVDIRECFRHLTNNGNLSNSQLMGVLLQDDAAAPLAAWNNYSSYLSRGGQIRRGKVVKLAQSEPLGSGAFSGPFSVAVNANAGVWDQATATYFYGSQLIVDPVRMLGKAGGTASVAATNGANGVLLPISFGSRLQAGILRLYRGTAAGTYDRYVDIPIGSIQFVYDNGSAANTFPWVVRTAGGMDSLSDVGDGEITWNGRTATWSGTANPTGTLGTFQTGDQILNPAPTAAGFIGRVCTVAPAPGAGTWTTFGATT